MNKTKIFDVAHIKNHFISLPLFLLIMTFGLLAVYFNPANTPAGAQPSNKRKGPMYGVAAANSPAAVRDIADEVLPSSGVEDELNQLLTTYGWVVLLPGSYDLNSTLVLPNDTILDGEKSAIVNVETGTNGLSLSAGSVARGFSVIGGDISVVIAGNDTEANNLHVSGSDIDGIHVSPGVEDARIVNNTVENVYRYGITVEGSAAQPVKHTVVQGNHIENTQLGGGLGLIGIGHYITFDSNTTKNTGGDGIAGYNSGNKSVIASNNNFEGPKNHCIHLGGNDLTIADNQCESPTQSGYFIRNHDSTVSNRYNITGNQVTNTVNGAGILVQIADDGVIANNNVQNANTHAVIVEDGVDVTISGNNLVGSVLGSGLRLHRITYAAVSGNTIKGHAQNGIYARDYSGTPPTKHVTITANTIVENTGYGVLSAESSDYLTVGPNTYWQNSSGDVSLVGTNNTVY